MWSARYNTGVKVVAVAILLYINQQQIASGAAPSWTELFAPQPGVSIFTQPPLGFLMVVGGVTMLALGFFFDFRTSEKFWIRSNLEPILKNQMALIDREALLTMTKYVIFTTIALIISTYIVWHYATRG